MEWAYFAGGVAVGVVLMLVLRVLFKPVVTRHQMEPSAPPPPRAPEPRVERKTGSCTVVLRSAGENKIPVIKAIRELNGSNLKDAKDCVDRAPSVVLKDVPRDVAERARRALQEAGGEAEIR